MKLERTVETEVAVKCERGIEAETVDLLGYSREPKSDMVVSIESSMRTRNMTYTQTN